MGVQRGDFSFIRWRAAICTGMSGMRRKIRRRAAKPLINGQQAGRHRLHAQVHVLGHQPDEKRESARLLLHQQEERQMCGPGRRHPAEQPRLSPAVEVSPSSPARDAQASARLIDQAAPAEGMPFHTAAPAARAIRVGRLGQPLSQLPAPDRRRDARTTGPAGEVRRPSVDARESQSPTPQPSLVRRLTASAMTSSFLQKAKRTKWLPRSGWA